MEDYKDISKLEELTTKYQKKAESSRNWVHHLQRNLDNVGYQSECGSLTVLRELVNQVALDNPSFTLKMEVEFFCGDFEQSIQTVIANCGTDIFDKNPEDFGETINMMQCMQTLL
ncbi:hypothetical protein EB796_007861 [Bugula neritina]|uniref:Uncharacterized protein n=1 Tax=Bugula neritina TaxID=10212 RepID=A0A7J7K6L7_BUGNE|nr:hypothetical protein EB796_007861 [Bugula neritina]